jgi:VWFA-related protein
MTWRTIAVSIALLLCRPAAWDQVRTGDRASRALFKGASGKQRPEFQYDPRTNTAVVKVIVQDPDGNFIPDVRPENFVVYADGVRQNNLAVAVEHPPVTAGLLLEYGGRFPNLNRELAGDVSRAAHQFVEALGKDDKAAIWTYGDSLNQLSDFSQDQRELKVMLLGLKPPELSEVNLYDALLAVLDRMKPVAGRKAVVVLSDGIDTFSRAKYEDVVAAARRSDTPIYAINLAPALREAAELHGVKIRVDWSAAEDRLGAIARASGGRLYSPSSIIDLTGTYDDLLENLKVRYVLTFRAPGDTAPRRIRVELTNPRTVLADL